MKNEVWKQVNENKRSVFYVSNRGRCKQVVKTTGEEKISNGGLNKAIGYMQFAKDYVHRHVAKAFIPNPLCLEQVDHINSDRTDNRVENLRWTTRKANNSSKHSIKARKENYRVTQHKDQIIKATKDKETLFFKNGYACAKALGCTPVLVYNAINNKLSARKAKGWNLEWVDIG